MISDVPVVGVLGDDPEICKALGCLLRSAGRAVATFASAAELLVCHGLADRWLTASAQ